MFVTGLVLAAGSSSRLGQPKQLLPYRGTTLLEVTLGVARQCHFDELLVTIGGAADEVSERVDFRDAVVVRNQQFGSGCSSSISAALQLVDPQSDGIVLMLGDQPEISPDAIHRLVGAASDSPLAVCRYDDGRGHPFWFHRDVFADLAGLHGDKAVWKLLESGRYDVAEVPVDGMIPLDVDTWDDYQALISRTSVTTSAD